MKPAILTGVQFVCIAILLFTNKWLTGIPFLTFIQASGLFLGTWALIEMSKSKINISPVPRKGAILIHSGPYRFLRHPMYLALILAFFPMLFTNHGILNLLVFGVFLVNLLLKLSYEEMLLQRHFEGYNELISKTWRLIPFIY